MNALLSTYRIGRPGFVRWLGSCLFALVLSACGGGNKSDDAGAMPVITSQPASADVIAGATVTFSVAVTGSDPLTFQWKENGVPIDGANAADFTTAVTTVGDSGAQFSVVASNPFGSTESTKAALTVHAGAASGGTASTVAKDYVLVGWVDAHANGSSQQHHYVLYLVDPAHPETTAIIEDFGETLPFIVYADAFEFDKEARTSLYRGAAEAFYVKNRRLWAIDLVAGLSHVPRQVSSSNVCGIKPFNANFYLPTDPSARVVWLEINDCTAPPAVNSRSFVKSSMTSSDAAVTIPANPATVFLDLPDVNRVFKGGIAQGIGQLDFYDKDFVRKGVVAGSAGLNLAKLGSGLDDFAGVRTAVLTIDNKLYRLTWTDTSAQIGPLGNSPGTASVAAADSSAVYLVDGLTILKQTGDGPAKPITTLTGPAIALLLLTDDRIIAQQSSGTGDARTLIVTSIAKTGDPAPVVLASSNGAVVATTSDSVVLGVNNELHLAKADGNGDRVLPYGSGVVYDPLQRNDYARAAGVWGCKPTTTTPTNCSNGMVEETLFDGTVLTLGQVSHAADYHFAVFGSHARRDVSSVSAVGLPELITFYDAGSALTDLYLVRHGQAGSLVRLTNNVP